MQRLIHCLNFDSRENEITVKMLFSDSKTKRPYEALLTLNIAVARNTA